MYRRNGRGRLLLLALVATAIAVITLDFRQSEGGPLERAKDISAAIVAPIQRGITAVVRPVGNFFSSLGDLANLREENNRLRAEVEQLASENLRAQALEEENAELRDVLGLKEPWTHMDKVTATVIGPAPSNYRWARYIDKGRADGIRRDMTVVSANGLVGKIVEVPGPHTAIVLLLVDPDASVAARFQEGRETGVVTGTGGGEPLLMELVDPRTSVWEGFRVNTSGYDGGIYPPGVPIGSVSEVSEKGAGLEKYIEVEPFVDFTKLDFVQVLLETGRRLEPVRATATAGTARDG